MNLVQISGRWNAGPNAGQRSTLYQVRAGLVFGLLEDGSSVLGNPSDFVADTGETGDAVLELLLSNPRALSLLRGTVRESLAAVYLVARLGQQETRAWDQYFRYIIDDGEGNCGVLDFRATGVVGALYRHDSRRAFDIDGAVSLAPVGQQEMLRLLVELPIFRYDERRTITSIFWTEGGLLCGPEPWHKVYLFGGDLLRRELMTDHEWRREAREEDNLDEALIDLIIQITERLVPLTPISLAGEELSVLIPENAPFRTEAFDQLLAGGVIVLN